MFTCYDTPTTTATQLEYVLEEDSIRYISATEAIVAYTYTTECTDMYHKTGYYSEISS